MEGSGRLDSKDKQYFMTKTGKRSRLFLSRVSPERSVGSGMKCLKKNVLLFNFLLSPGMTIA